MLKHIPAFMDAELLWVLAAMGHGDELAVVDRNFPARSVADRTMAKKLVTLGGMNATQAIIGILELLPLDDFVQEPLLWMEPCDHPGSMLPVHSQVIDACRQAERREVGHVALERQQFYERARDCFAIVQTSENRPYGNFILKKGVVFDS